MKLVILKPECDNPDDTLRLDKVLKYCLGVAADGPGKIETEWICTAEQLERRMLEPGQLQGERILFAVALDACGANLQWYLMMRCIRQNPLCMRSGTAGLLVDGASELYTKSVADETAFSANQAGCLFVGRPLAEGTKELRNFQTAAAHAGMGLYEAYLEAAKLLMKRILEFGAPYREAPRILCLYAGNREMSNTFSLWRLVRGILEKSCRIREIFLENGKIYDCLGCSYRTCLRYGLESKCIYGGAIVEEVYPAIEQCDALLMLCPNYNDALGANLTAFINRLTALFRKRQFYEKYVFAIIVSGYSGGDIIARQLIGSLNMNKTFILPGRFALIETANDPGSVLRAEGIEERAFKFADRILEQFSTKNK